MTDLKNFYQQHFHKLEKANEIISDVLVNFNKELDKYGVGAKRYAIDGNQLKEIQTLEMLYQALNTSGNILMFEVLGIMVSNGLVKQNSDIQPPPPPQPELKN